MLSLLRGVDLAFQPAQIGGSAYWEIVARALDVGAALVLQFTVFKVCQ